jgi:hypothetical protein
MVRAARRRADRAKVLVVVLAAVLFTAGLGLARRSYASHGKHRAQPLAAPPRFESIVQQNSVGVVAPAQAPASAQTSTS